MNYFLRRISVIFDNQTVTCSDFSVKIFNLPGQDDIDKYNSYNRGHINFVKEITKMLTDLGYDVTQVNLVYDIEDYVDLKKNYNKYKRKEIKTRY